MSQKDVRIAQLESEVEQLRRERDLWEARALGGVPAEDVGGVERSRRSRFIVISSQKLEGAAREGAESEGGFAGGVCLAKDAARRG